MLQIVLLMIAGKLQEGGGPVWGWALLFAAVSTVVFGHYHPLAIAVTAGYACAYFWALRRVSDSLPMWFAVYLGGGLLPFGLLALFFAA